MTLHEWNPRGGDYPRAEYSSHLDRFILQQILGSHVSAKIVRNQTELHAERTAVTDEQDAELMKLLENRETGYASIDFASFTLANEGKVSPVVNGLNYVRNKYTVPSVK